MEEQLLKSWKHKNEDKSMIHFLAVKTRFKINSTWLKLCLLEEPLMQRGQMPNLNGTLKTCLCSWSTEVCVLKLIEPHLYSANSIVRCIEFRLYIETLIYLFNDDQFKIERLITHNKEILCNFAKSKIAKKWCWQFVKKNV